MDATTPRAPIRLRRLGVHAVALVPEGANLIQWALIRKALPMADGAPLTLPRAAMEAITVQLGKTIEALLALLDAAKTATPTDDPAAVVAPEFCDALEAAAMSLMGLAEQFEAPAPGMEPGAQPMQMSAEQATAGAAMSLALAKAFKGLLAKSAAAMVAKSAAGATVIDGVQKAGPVKMTYEGAMKLHSAMMEKVYDMLKAVAPMFMAMDIPEPAAAALAKSLTEQLGTMLDAKLAPMATRIGAVEKTAEAISKGRPAPNSEPDSITPPAPTGEFKMPFGQNLSEMVKKGKSFSDSPTGGPAAAK